MAICVTDPLTEEEKLSLLLDPDPMDGGPHDNAWERRLRRKNAEWAAGQRPEWAG